VLVKDLAGDDGVLLVGRGHEVSESMLELIRNHILRGNLSGSVLVTFP
jgi:hypothetical protein